MDLSYFINKPCTIFTVPINRNFTEKQLLDYFTGFVESFDENGIFIKQLTGNQKTYIFLNNVISIAEEAMSYNDPPEIAQPPIKNIQKQSQKDKYIINPDALADMAKQMKNSY
jgi:hypothetical protein